MRALLERLLKCFNAESYRLLTCLCRAAVVAPDKHYTGEPCYPFGYGQSYSQFAVEWANSSHHTVTTDALEQSQ